MGTFKRWEASKNSVGLLRNSIQWKENRWNQETMHRIKLSPRNLQMIETLVHLSNYRDLSICRK